MPVLLTRQEEFEALCPGSGVSAGQIQIVQEGFKKQDLLAAAA
jgi:hypothetical protein